MDISQLKNFQMIASHKRLTHAAHALYISEPALSLSLARLERELGLQLFDRVGRTIILNECGKVFLKHVNEMLYSLENAKTEIDLLLNRSSNKITICWDFMGVLEDYVIQYIGRCSHITVNHYYVPDYQMRDELNKPDCDFAIVWTEDPKSYSYEKIVFPDHEWYIAIPSDHPLAQSPSPRLSQFSEEHFSVSALNLGHKKMTQLLCRNAGFECKIAYMATPTICLDLVIEKKCITFVSKGMVKLGEACSLYTDKIVFIPLLYEDCNVYSLLMWNSKRKLSIAALDFLDYMRDHAQLIK